MPVLKNSRHEAFCQAVAEGRSQTEAYIEAGYAQKDANSAASRLSANVSISNRVQELKAKAAKRCEITAESLLQRGMQLLDKAESAADFKAASQTLERVAKIGGFWVDKSETTDKTPGMDPAVRQAEITRLLTKLGGAPASGSGDGA